MGWKVGGSIKRDGICVYLGLIHIFVWQKPSQHCKEIILQLKIKKNFCFKGAVVKRQNFQTALPSCITSPAQTSNKLIIGG